MIFQDEQGTRMSLPSQGWSYQPCQHQSLEMFNIKKSRHGGRKETKNLFQELLVLAAVITTHIWSKQIWRKACLVWRYKHKSQKPGASFTDLCRDYQASALKSRRWKLRASSQQRPLETEKSIYGVERHGRNCLKEQNTHRL